MEMNRRSPDGIARMVEAAMQTHPAEVLGLLGPMSQLLGAQAARLYVADYSLRFLQQIDQTGKVGPPQPIEGTLIGRAFTSDEILVSGTLPTTVVVPLGEETNRMGVLELDFEEWDGVLPELLDPILSTFVMTWIVKNRYSDTAQRARRSKALTAAAEAQWELLPPLSCSTDRIAVSGIVEPAYDIGGDSFDYAFDRSRIDFAVVDAIGRGLPAVLMAAAAINSLRNSRRSNLGVADAYEHADRLIAAQFGDSYFVTGHICSLDLPSGTLTWVNAGHPLPMLMRDGNYVGTLDCKPSLPLGLGGPVVEVAEHTLQRGDRVLFYTDGITESRASDGSLFGADRLSDYLTRAALEQVPVHETIRHLTDSIVNFNDEGLRDDAMMFLIEWRGAY